MRAITSDGVGVHYRVDGRDNAAVVLLVNSLGSDLTMWAAQVPALSSSFRVVRYDQRGSGASDVPSGPYTIAQHGGDALAVLDASGVDEASVCGVSLGGLVALWLAARVPARVRRGVYANSAPRIGSLQLWEARAAAVEAGGMAAVADTVIERLLSPRFRDHRPEEVARVREVLLSTSAQGYAAACRGLRDIDLGPLLAGLAVPSLVIAGAQDVATPMAVSLELAERIPGSERLVLNSGHLSNIEQPDQFNAALLSFLGT